MSSPRNVTGKTIMEAEFDPKIASHGRAFISLIMFITVVGIPFIPFVLLFSLWYFPEYLRRTSARLTAHALEIRKGVFFRKEATIPLNRVTDVLLHDGPLMRHYGLRGLRVETAGQGGEDSSGEGNLVGVVDATKLRDAILRQRQKVVSGEQQSPTPAGAGMSGAAGLLTEIRDILARMEAQGRSKKG